MEVRARVVLCTKGAVSTVVDHRSPLAANKRRVLHVAQSVETGVAHVVDALLRWQRDAGWDVALAAPPGRLSALAASTGAPVLDWAAAREPGLSVVAEGRRLRRLVRDFEPDLVHLHSAKAGLVGRLVLRGRLPTVYTPHGWSWLAVEGTYRYAVEAWERVACRWCDAIVCLSDRELHQAGDVGLRGNLRLIPNDVDSKELRALAGASHAGSRRALGVPEGVPLVVCCARLAPQKGQDILLAAWPGVRRGVPDAELVLVGDGPWRRQLEQSSRGLSGVTFTGMCDRGATLQWMCSADVVVCPSRYEGMSLVPLEAAALGRPVVASDVEGMDDELPVDGRRLVPPEDPAALAGALRDLLADLDAARAAGLAARDWSDRNAGRPHAAERNTALYEEVLAQRGHVPSSSKRQR